MKKGVCVCVELRKPAGEGEASRGQQEREAFTLLVLKRLEEITMLLECTEPWNFRRLPA